MQRAREHGVDRGRRVRRELLQLVLAVLVVDALFIAGYLLFRLSLAANPVKIAYTAGWTVAALLVVLRALTRIRTLRRQPR